MAELNAPNMEMQPKLSRNGKRLWSKAQKRLIVGEAMRSGISVSVLSRRYDINANLIFRWMKLSGFEAEKKQQLIPVGVIAPPTVSPSKQDQTAKSSPPSSLGGPKHRTRRGLDKALSWFIKAILCVQTKERLDATNFFQRLIRGGIQTHNTIADKAGNAGVAGFFGDAARDDLPVAAGGACCDEGANGFGAP